MEKNQVGQILTGQNKTASVMDELLDRLSLIIEQTEKNVYGYREVLGNLDSLSLPMDEHQSEPKISSEYQITTVVNRLSVLVNQLDTATHKQSEMLEHFQKLI
jgi:hypothetical protein